MLDLETAFPLASPLSTPCQRPDALGITSCTQCPETCVPFLLCVCLYLHLKYFSAPVDFTALPTPTPYIVYTVVTGSETFDSPVFLPLCYRTGPVSASSLAPLCLACSRCFPESILWSGESGRLHQIVTYTHVITDYCRLQGLSLIGSGA